MLCYILLGVASVHYDVILSFYKYIYIHCHCQQLWSTYFQSLVFLPAPLIQRANAVCLTTHPQGRVIAWQQLLAIRLAPQQILQIALVNRAIGLCVAAQFGSRVTCSCHVTVALKDLLAIPYRWPNVRVWTLVLHWGEKKQWYHYIWIPHIEVYFFKHVLCWGALTSCADVTWIPEVRGVSSLRTNGLFWVWFRADEKARLWGADAERPRCSIWYIDLCECTRKTFLKITRLAMKVVWRVTVQAYLFKKKKTTQKT